MDALSGSPFALLVGRNWVEPTFSRLLGLPVRTFGNAQVEFSLKRGWMIHAETSDRRLQVGGVLMASTLELRSPGYLKTSKDPEASPFRLTGGLGWAPEANTWSSDEARIIFNPGAPLKPGDVEIVPAALEMPGASPLDSRKAVRLELAVSGSLSVTAPDAKIESAAGPAARIDVSSGPEVDGTDWQLTMRHVGPAREVRSASLGSLELAADGPVIASTLRATGFDLVGFVADAPVRGLAAPLLEEGTHGLRGWLSLPVAAPLHLRLAGLPVPEPGPEPEDPAEAEDDALRVSPRARTLILDAPPGATEALDLNLDGARLTLRRPRDGLALTFRFFNLRLSHDGRTGTLCPDPLPEGAPRPPDFPDGPILRLELLGRHILKEAYPVQTVQAADYPQLDWTSYNNWTREKKKTVANALQVLLEATGSPELRLEARQKIQKEVLPAEKDGDSVREFERKLIRDIDGSNGFIGGTHFPFRARTVIPPDQKVYLGPDFMDRDVRELGDRIIAKNRSIKNIPPDRLARSRQGGASRLCCHWVRPAGTPFSLAALLDWEGLDLSVSPRARQAFTLTEDGRRVPLEDASASLAIVGIRPNTDGPGYRAAADLATRMGNVFEVASRTSREHETALELITRLVCALHETAAPLIPWTAPEGVFDRADPWREVPNVPLWSIGIDPAGPNPGLIALDSPDFRPDGYLPGNGPILLEYYELPGEAPMRVALSPKDRHFLVDHGVPGRPAIGGAVVEAEVQTVADRGQPAAAPTFQFGAAFAAPEAYRLRDVRTDAMRGAQSVEVSQTIMRPQRLNFTEVTFDAIGPSASIDTAFALTLPAYAKGQDSPAFRANDLQALRYDETQGQDEGTLVSTKGFLLPCGHPAARVTATRTRPVRPSKENGRDNPVAHERLREWIQVADPIKQTWLDCPFDGRDMPPGKVEILAKRTPDLVSTFLDKEEYDAVGPGWTAPNGRLNLGPAAFDRQIFWPRLARAAGSSKPEALTRDGMFQFELRLGDSDETVEMPLLFVAQSAMAEPSLLRALCAYYMSLRGGGPGSPRTIVHGFARRRYAAEIKAGDTTYETHTWTMGMQGRIGPETAMPEVDFGGTLDVGLDRLTSKFQTEGSTLYPLNFNFGPLLVAANQPPAYPFLEGGKLRLDRIGRQLGRQVGPLVSMRYDRRFVERSASAESAEGPGAQDIRLPPPEQPDVVLEVLQGGALPVGDRGDRLGAVGRPAGVITHISRREGPLIQSPRAERISSAALSARPVIARTVEPKLAAANSGALASDSEALIRQLVGETKLCGFIRLADILIYAAGALADQVPAVEEAIDYAAGTAEDLVLALRDRVIPQLSRIVDTVRERLDRITIPGLADGSRFRPIDAYPDLKVALAGLDQALRTAQAAEETSDLLASGTRIITAGRTLESAIDDISRDPSGPLIASLLGEAQKLLTGLDRFPTDLGQMADGLTDVLVDLEREAVAALKTQFEAMLSGAGEDLVRLVPARLRAQDGNEAPEAMLTSEGAAAVADVLKTAGEALVEELFAEVTSFEGLATSVATLEWERRAVALATDLTEALEAEGTEAEARLTDLGEALLAPVLVDLTDLEDALAQAEGQTQIRAHLQAQAGRLVQLLAGVDLEGIRGSVDAVEQHLRALKDTSDPGEALAALLGVTRIIDRLFLDNRLRKAASDAWEELQPEIEGQVDALWDLVRGGLCQIDALLDLLAGGLREARPEVPEELLATLHLLAEEAPELGRLEELQEALDGRLYFHPGPTSAAADPVHLGARLAWRLRRLAVTLRERVEALPGTRAAGQRERLEQIAVAVEAARVKLGADVAGTARSVASVLRALRVVEFEGAVICPPTEMPRTPETLLAMIRDFPRLRLEDLLVVQTDLPLRAAVLTQTAASAIPLDRLADLRSELDRILADVPEEERDALNDWREETEAILRPLADAALADALQLVDDAVRGALGHMAAAWTSASDVTFARLREIAEAKAAALDEAQALMREVDASLIAVADPDGLLGPVIGVLRDDLRVLRETLTAGQAADAAELARIDGTLEAVRDAVASRTSADLASAAKALRPRLEDLPRQIRQLMSLRQSPGGPAESQVARLRDRVLASASRSLSRVGDLLVADAEATAAEILGQVLDPILDVLGSGFSPVWQEAVALRNTALERLSDNDERTFDERTFLAAFEAILGRPPGTLLVAARTEAEALALLAEAPRAPKDALFREARSLRTLANGDATPVSRFVAFDALAAHWSSGPPAPVRIVEQVSRANREIARIELSDLVRLDDLKDDIVAILLRFVPSKMTTRMSFSSMIRGLPSGLFRPLGEAMPGKPGTGRFSIEAETGVSLINTEETPAGEVIANATGRLTPFAIKLLGDSFDAITMEFTEATFRTGTGQPADITLNFSRFVIGPQLAYLADLAEKLGDGGDGPFVEPARGFPGITAGYRLQLPAITLGGATFLNIGLLASATLPFDDRRAIFTLSVSSRDNPFIILAGVFGGGGHFALHTDGEQLIGMDASFVMSAGGAVSFGVLNLTAYISIGVYVRKFGSLTEISGDFFAGGSGKIAFFSISAALTVRMGQTNAGDMVGSAVFSFSFSISFAKFRFAVTVWHQEPEGFAGAGEGAGSDRASLDGGSGGAFGADRARIWLAAADEDPDRPKSRGRIILAAPRIEDDFPAWSAMFAAPPSLDDLLTE